MVNLKVGATVKYQSKDDDNWYTGIVTRDSNGQLYIADSEDRSVTYYPVSTDNIEEVN